MADRITTAEALSPSDFGTSVLVDLGRDEYVAGKLRGIRAEYVVDQRYGNGTVAFGHTEIELLVATVWVTVESTTPIKISED